MLLVVASQMKSNNAVMSFLIIISYTLFLLCLYLWYNSIRQWSKNKFNKFYLFFISLYLVWNFCMIFYYQTKSKTAAMLISYISSNWIGIFSFYASFYRCTKQNKAKVACIYFYLSPIGNYSGVNTASFSI